jgi:hypothetical protein
LVEQRDLENLHDTIRRPSEHDPAVVTAGTRLGVKQRRKAVRVNKCDIAQIKDQ